MTTSMLIHEDAMSETEPGPGLQITADQLDLSKHDGTVTLVSPKTGDHRTFRVRTVHNPESRLFGQRLVELLVGPDNGNDYQAFATIESGTGSPVRLRVWYRYRNAAVQKLGSSVHEAFADMLARPGHWAGRGVEYLISLRCRRCGRDLTHPESIRDGLGPICREKSL